MREPPIKRAFAAAGSSGATSRRVGAETLLRLAQAGFASRTPGAICVIADFK
jgi:hypothetical protein